MHQRESARFKCKPIVILWALWSFRKTADIFNQSGFKLNISFVQHLTWSLHPISCINFGLNLEFSIDEYGFRRDRKCPVCPEQISTFSKLVTEPKFLSSFKKKNNFLEYAKLNDHFSQYFTISEKTYLHEFQWEGDTCQRFLNGFSKFSMLCLTIISHWIWFHRVSSQFLFAQIPICVLEAIDF